MNRKELEIVHLNAKMMEHETDALKERSDKLAEASQAIADKYLDKKTETTQDFSPPEYFDDAVKYATDLLYTTGQPIYNKDDIQRTIKNQIDWAEYAKSEEWLPKDTEKKAVVSELIEIGSYLSNEDSERAYGPHVDGRPHETLDPYDTDYNKFGTAISRR